jgi:hypothetical protein
MHKIFGSKDVSNPIIQSARLSLIERACDVLFPTVGRLLPRLTDVTWQTIGRRE